MVSKAEDPLGIESPSAMPARQEDRVASRPSGLVTMWGALTSVMGFVVIFASTSQIAWLAYLSGTGGAEQFRYVLFDFTARCLAAVMGILMLVGGNGLLRRTDWGRGLMFVIAAVIGLVALIGLMGSPSSIMLKLYLLYSVVTAVLLLSRKTADEFSPESTRTTLDES